MELVDGRLHLSQPGLIKKLITTAELQDNKRSVRIPIRTDWNEDEQDKTARCEGGIFRTLLVSLWHVSLLRFTWHWQVQQYQQEAVSRPPQFDRG